MVSVVMPVYNAMPYLKLCLQSICAQSYKKWELIAVDDFSTDDSLKTLRSFANTDTRIKVFKNCKKGIIPALQLAHQMSSGIYITRMDADDVMPTEKLKCMHDALEFGRSDCVVGYVQYFSDNVLQEGYIKYEKWLNTLIDNRGHYQEIYKECVIPSPCWMMRNDKFIKIGGFSNNVYPEDYDLAFRMYENKILIQSIPKVLHYWRDHDSRASRNNENYQDQRFYHLKVHYFLKLDRDSKKSLVLWGAGKSAKSVAKLLIAKNINFRWISNNSKKIGKDIYGFKIESESILKRIFNHQIISVIKEPNYLQRVQLLYVESKKNANEFYFFH